MNCLDYLRAPRCLILVVLAAGTLAIGSMAVADDALPGDDLPASEDSRPGPLGLGVSGSSAGITTDYFEQALAEAVVASEIFSEIDRSKTAEVMMPMIRAKGVFPGSTANSDAPYFLDVRIIEVETPSFSVRMTVGMKAVWTLYYVADKTELMKETVESKYTGGIFEGGVHGANRVRVAMEGSTQENIKMGVAKLKALDLQRDVLELAQE